MATTELSKRLIEALEGAGLKPRSYSGRYMYGKQCVGVSADSSFDIGVALADVCVPAPNEDQLGRRYIFYWPSYEWPEDQKGMEE